ncbi:MAG: hypothetical protein V1660_01945 [archaeon]
MQQIEKNIVKSFNRAKSDIKMLESKINALNTQHESMKDMLDTLRHHEQNLYLRMKGKNLDKTSKKAEICVKKPKHTIYVAPKTGKKFHIKNCPFAQNIMPKNKIIFKSKTKALNKGFKPCHCVK